MKLHITWILSLGLLLTACQAATEQASSEEHAMPSTHSLEGSAWWVEYIDQRGVVDRSHTTIAFPEAGRVAGDSACNRYQGAVELGSESVRFGAIASTRRACTPAISDQEQRFYAALSRVVAWEVNDKGHLQLLDENGSVVVRAARIDPDDA